MPNLQHVMTLGPMACEEAVVRRSGQHLFDSDTVRRRTARCLAQQSLNELFAQETVEQCWAWFHPQLRSSNQAKDKHSTAARSSHIFEVVNITLSEEPYILIYIYIVQIMCKSYKGIQPVLLQHQQSLPRFASVELNLPPCAQSMLFLLFLTKQVEGTCTQASNHQHNQQHNCNHRTSSHSRKLCMQCW